MPLLSALFGSARWLRRRTSIFDAKSIRATRHSYFDGDADRQRNLDYPAAGVAEDTLWQWARGMAAPALVPGESRTVPFLPALPSAK